jgi:hypothetical protein
VVTVVKVTLLASVATAQRTNQMPCHVSICSWKKDKRQQQQQWWRSSSSSSGSNSQRLPAKKVDQGI